MHVNSHTFLYISIYYENIKWCIIKTTMILYKKLIEKKHIITTVLGLFYVY